MVLARGARFVGFGASTFSFYLQQFRTLQGLPKASSVLVNASIISTDPLFSSAGVISGSTMPVFDPEDLQALARSDM